MTVLSGTHNSWTPTAWPADTSAAAALRSYLGQETDLLYATRLDFRDANLEGADLQGGWIIGSDFSRTNLRNADLGGAHGAETIFHEADLTSANLAKATLQRADFLNARLTNSSLVRAEAPHASFVHADLRGVKFTAGDFMAADFSGADMSASDLESAHLDGAVLAGTLLTGASGGVFGPVVISLEPNRVMLDGEDLEQWFISQGAKIRVYPHTHGSESRS